MSQSPRILVFAGSARRGSFNKRLAKLAAERIEAHGGRPTLIDLADYPMPLYDGDLEETSGLPESALALREQLAEHQGLLIASPEYNGFITPLLKNTIDWLTRPHQGDSGLALFQGRLAAVVAASPGGLGGLRGLALIRQLLGNIGVTVLPDQLAVAGAGDAFDEEGRLVQEGQRKSLDGICRRLVEDLERLHG
ncbi:MULTISPECIES: NADPH-dependent FMN reductase [Halomonas]|uniref:Oxidoreductase n=2 Tax=Halomonas TaxID=2745 RepID=A0ABQ0U5V5_9GAMM|nr:MULTISPECIES: NAD(P)H-dependent oxidoreductase [Halomonas]PSJ20720.1 NADPH-dependent oxidoreductase [Halomonas sp. ND22Bw]KGE78033.1 FMN reductase [Halomonas salina]MDR5890861.1 NAD(P)H-dependent oxidoreductase [Halomonas salina]RAH39553.1 NADPH-dependent oxidoreductase [Halomonas sp. SL1]WJY06463.1 NAD(P)H-dependent oxidoreductase [Halomonas halophila]